MPSTGNRSRRIIFTTTLRKYLLESKPPKRTMSLDSFSSILSHIWPRGRGGGRRPQVSDEIDSEVSTGSAEDSLERPLYLQPLGQGEQSRLTIVQITDVYTLVRHSQHCLPACVDPALCFCHFLANSMKYHAYYRTTLLPSRPS